MHDCFTITELVLMEDLGFSERGAAWRDELDGVYDLDGELPVNPDGGLKSFGHPVGASGLRMMFEAWLQLRGEAPPERQVEAAKPGGDRGLALTHNLGRLPGRDGELRLDPRPVGHPTGFRSRRQRASAEPASNVGSVDITPARATCPVQLVPSQ